MIGHGTPEHDEAWAREHRQGRRFGLAFLTMSFFVVVLALVALVWMLAPAFTKVDISPADRSATAEARTFATSVAIRTAEAEARYATQTAYAHVTSTAAAVAEATGVARAAATATAAARETAQAPPTLTARTVRFEQEEATANATATALTAAAVLVQEPVEGLLEMQGRLDGPVCITTSLQLRRFIASAKFENPAAPNQEKWDYGISFANLGADTFYALHVGSEGDWGFRLQGKGFYILNRDDSTLVDMRPGGTNRLMLYVADGNALIYVNGKYVTQADMGMMGMNESANAEHVPGLCTGFGEGTVPLEVRYSDFAIWQLP